MAGEISSFLGGFSGSTIGSAVVKLFLDSSAYNAEMAATDRSLTGTTGKFNAFSAAGAAAFSAVGLAAVSFVGDSIAAFSEAEEVMAQTEAVVKSTGQAAGITASELADMAHGFQDTTRFSDEAVQSMQNVLLTFTQIGGDVIPETTQAVLDMSTALGTDLQSAAIQVGKALNNPTIGLTALRRVGVSFTDHQVKLIENYVDSNQLMKAQRIILDELSREFGGSASAALDTFGGKMDQINNRFNDFQERVGGGATTSVVGIVDAIGGWIRTNATLNNSLQLVGQGTSDMEEGLQDGVGFLGDIEDAARGAAHRFISAAGAVENFAGLAGESLREFRTDTKETFTTADDVLSRLAERAHITGTDIVQAFNRQNRALSQYAKNVREVKELGIEDDVLSSLSELGLEGAQILEALANSSKREIDKVNRTFDTNVERADKVTASILGVGGAVKNLDGRKAQAEVAIKYVLAKGSLDPTGLPGLGDG